MSDTSADRLKFDWQRALLKCDIPTTTKLVGMALSTFANKRGGNAHPGIDRLGPLCGLRKAALLRHLAALENEYGLIRCTFRRRPGPSRGGRGWANVYQLVIPADLGERVGFVALPEVYDGRPLTDEVYDDGPVSSEPNPSGNPSRGVKEVYAEETEVHAGSEEVYGDTPRGLPGETPTGTENTSRSSRTDKHHSAPLARPAASASGARKPNLSDRLIHTYNPRDTHTPAEKDTRTAAVLDDLKARDPDAYADLLADTQQLIGWNTRPDHTDQHWQGLYRAMAAQWLRHQAEKENTR